MQQKADQVAAEARRMEAARDLASRGTFQAFCLGKVMENHA